MSDRRCADPRGEEETAGSSADGVWCASAFFDVLLPGSIVAKRMSMYDRRRPGLGWDGVIDSRERRLFECDLENVRMTAIVLLARTCVHVAN